MNFIECVLKIFLAVQLGPPKIKSRVRHCGGLPIYAFKPGTYFYALVCGCFMSMYRGDFQSTLGVYDWK